MIAVPIPIKTMNQTTTLFIDEERIDVEIEELSPLEQRRWSYKLDVRPDGTVAMSPKMVDWMVDLAVSQTILTKELVREIPSEELDDFFNDVVNASFGNEISSEEAALDKSAIRDMEEDDE